MIHNLAFSFGLSTILLILKFLIISLTKKNWKQSFMNIDIQNIILEWIFSSIALFCFISISNYFRNSTYLVIVLLGVIFGSFFMSYGFFIYPFLIILRKNKFKTSDLFENWAKINLNDKDIVIRILKYDIINAYATGVFSVSKVILLTDKLIEKLQDKDIKNLIYHEYAHLKYNHLLILYISNVFCCTISVISASHFYPIFETTDNPGLLVAFHGALFGGLYILIPGLVQRKLEYKADKYASNIVGAISYIETLKQLNILTNGGLEKKAINYPTLTERINNVASF